jgi:hypothetical protein
MINGRVIILIYVDDLLLFGKLLEDINSVKHALRQRFDMKDKGEARECLGLSTTRDRSKRRIRFGVVNLSSDGTSSGQCNVLGLKPHF